MSSAEHPSSIEEHYLIGLSIKVQKSAAGLPEKIGDDGLFINGYVPDIDGNIGARYDITLNGSEQKLDELSSQVKYAEGYSYLVTFSYECFQRTALIDISYVLLKEVIQHIGWLMVLSKWPNNVLTWEWRQPPRQSGY